MRGSLLGTIITGSAVFAYRHNAVTIHLGLYIDTTVSKCTNHRVHRVKYQKRPEHTEHKVNRTHCCCERLDISFGIM